MANFTVSNSEISPILGEVTGAIVNKTDYETLTETQLTQMRIDEIVSKINFCSMLFGIFGNLICIGVLFHRKMLRKKFHIYLLALAFSDLFFCLIVFSNYAFYIFNPPNLLYDISWFTCLFTDYIYKSFDATGVLLTLIVSLDRIYAITRPINFRNSLTLRYPKLLVILTTVIVFLLKSPNFYLVQREYIQESGIFYCNSKTEQSGALIYIILCNFILPFLLNFIPAVVILVINLTLWMYIHNYTKTSDLGQSLTKRRHISKSQKSHYLTIIILGIWLLLTTVPYYLFCTYYWVMQLQDNYRGTSTILTIQGITSAFFNLNHCLNFIIYMLFHRDFQEKVLSYIVRAALFVSCYKCDKRMAKSNENKAKYRRTELRKMSIKSKTKFFKPMKDLDLVDSSLNLEASDSNKNDV